MKYFIFIPLFFFAPLYSLTVGSDTAPSRETLATFPTATDNEILGFAVLEDGFELTDNSTTVSFNAFFPVAGDIDLNEGEVYIRQDFMMSSAAELISTGTFHGDGHVIVLPYRIDVQLPTVQGLNPLFLENLALHLNSRVTLNAGIECCETCVIDGRGSVLDLNNNDIVVLAGASLLIKDAHVVGLSNGTLRCQDNSASLIFQNTTLFLEDDFTFSIGSFQTVEDVVISGTGTFIYQSTQSSTIGAFSRLKIDHGITFSYDPVDASRDLLLFTDSTSSPFLFNCTLFSTATGMQLTQGTLVLDGRVVFESDASNQNEGIQFGDGSAVNDLVIDVMPGAEMELASGYLDYQNVN